MNNKNILIKMQKTVLGVIFCGLFSSSLNAIGVEKKTGNVFTFNFGYGYNIKQPSLSPSEGKSVVSAEILDFYRPLAANSNGHGGFAFEFVDSYEMFFTQMHGLRISVDITYQFLKSTLNSASGAPFLLKDNLSFSGHFFDLGASIDYRNDFYRSRSGKWDIGLFVGLGYGYTFYDEVFARGTANERDLYDYEAGGMNYEGGFIFTYNDFFQIELGMKYKDRKELGNLNTYAGFGFRF